jgi:glycosyltransferase involved in cell wall biosynthesis
VNPETGKRITYITAGAAGMYCGSCMHDNTLARALGEANWDTLLVPTYTPIRTDETEVSVDQVFLGGINVFLQQKVPLFRHLPKLFDRFLDKPSMIRRVTSRAIETNPKMLGELAVSMLRGNSGNQRKEVRRLVSWLREEAHPDVLILSNILIAGFVRDLKNQLGAPVIVTLQGDDIFLESLQEPHKSRALELIRGLDPHIDAYLVHSNFYADAMSKYLGLPRDKMHVTPLGIDTRDFAAMPARDAGGERRPTIGFLARLTADKGLHHIVDAFIKLKSRPENGSVQLKIAGWLGSDHVAFANEQFARLDAAGLRDDYEHLGSVSRQQKLEMLQSIDVLSVPTEYLEPKGLYVLEALAAGVPVVQPNHGVFPELLDDLGGGLLFEAGNTNDLADQLQRLLTDGEFASQLGQRGRESVENHRNASAMARATIRVLDEVLRTVS